MVAIVGGSELGVNANSGKVLGGQGQTGSAGQGRSGEGVVVNAVTGNLVLLRQDELVIGTHSGPNIDLLRTYNSRGLATDDNGDNWRLGYSRKVYGLTGTANSANSTVKRIDEDGSEILYTWDTAKSAYVSKAGDGGFDKLTYNTTSQVWTWYDGASTRTETYAGASNGRLSTVADPNGHTLTLGYNGSGLVSSIASSSGDQVTIGYTGNNITQFVTSYKDSDNVVRTLTRVRYEYDANRLSKVTVDLSPTDNVVTDNVTYVTTYTYDGASNRVASITQTDGSRLEFTYILVGTDYRVRTVKDMRLNDSSQYVAYNTTSFNYDVANNQTLIIDGNGRQTFWKYDANGQVQSIREAYPAGGQLSELKFTYDGDGNVTAATDAQGNTTTYSYDTSGNRTLQRDAMGNTVTRTFGSRNELLTETTYTGVDSNPADANNATGARTTYYVYNGTYNLSFIISPEGRVTRFVTDAQGRVGSKLVYTELFDPVATQPTLLNLLSWVGTRKDKNQRTDYGYDVARGQLQTVTEYRSVDVNGIGQAGTVMYYVYDQAGQLRSTLDANGATATYTYDGLGRMLTAIDGAGVMTVTSYDDQHRRTTVRVDPNSNLYGGPVTTRAYDEAGLLLSVEKGDTETPIIGTTRYVYDSRGNLVREIGANGASTYHIYDAANRLVADIDPSGAVVEYTYGDPKINNGSIGLKTTETLTYTSPSNIKLNLDVQPAPGGPSSLSVTVKTYLGGKLLNAQTQAATGTATTSFSNIDVSTCDLMTVEVWYGDTLVGVAVQDSIVALRDQGAAHYAAAGNTAVTEAAVVVTERLLVRPNDHVTKTIRYANTVNVGLRYVDDDGIQRQDTSAADATLLKLEGNYDGIVGLRPMASPDDRIDYNFYDAADRLIKTIDGTGAVKEFFYDGAGQLTSSRQSATRLSATALNMLKTLTGNIPATNPFASLPPGLTDYRVVQNSYSADGKLVGVLDGDNYWTVNRYDAAGQLVESVRRALAGADKFSVDNSADLHTYYLHDGKGQVTGVIDPAGYLTEYRYDDVGNKTTVTRYATAVTATDPSLLVANVRPATSAEDRNTNYMYDGGNRLLATFEYQGAFRDDVFGSTDGFGTYYHDLDANGKPRIVMRGQGAPDQIYWGVAGASAGTLQYQVTQREYDDYGRVTAEMSPSAYKVALTPLTALPGETQAELEARQLARDAGLWTRYTYDADGRMINKIDPADAEGRHNITLYFYDVSGRLIDVVDGAGTVNETSYNAFGEVASTRTFATLATVDQTLDRGQLAPADASRISQNVFTYNRRGELASKTTGQGSVNVGGTSNQGYEEFTYNSFGELASHKTLTAGSNYVYETFGYNNRGLVNSNVRDSGTGTANLASATQYDAFGRATQVTDARNKVWSKTYDKLGRVITITDPETPQRTISYDAFGRVIDQTDALNKHTTFAYNAANRTLTTTTPEGVVTVATSDTFGQVISLRDGRGNTTTYTYDLDGRLLDVAAPIGTGTDVSHKTSVYDTAGHLIEVIENGVKTAYTYDVIGRMLTRTVDAGDGAGNLNITTRTVYNLYGDKMSEAGSDGVWTQDASGIWTQTRYDLKGEVVSVTVDPALIPNAMGGLFAKTGALNLRTEFAYDSRGNKVKVTEGAGSSNPKVTVYEYDNAGRRVAEVVDQSALNIRTSYTYDANDNVVTKKDPNGNVTRYVYDDRNLLAYTIDPTGAAVKTVRDGNGRVIQVTAYADRIALSGFAAPSATVTGELTRTEVEALLTTPILNNAANQTSYTVYDQDGRALFDIDAAKAVTERQYDKNGNVIRTTRYAKAITVPTDRSIANIQSAIAATNTDATLNQNDYSVFDRANRQIYFIDAGGYATRTFYDSDGRVAQQIQFYTALVGTTGFYNGTDTFAPTVTANANSDRKTRMYYDAAGRLRFSVDGEGYVTERRYDERSLETSLIRYATQYRAVITDSDTYATMVTRFSAAATGSDAVSTRTYDAGGRLDTQYDGDGDGVLGTTRHVYDAVGRETITYVNEGLENRDSIATRVYDAAGRLTDEYGGNQPNPTATHIQYVLDKAGNRVAVIDPNGNTGYFYFDGDNRNVLQVDPEGYVTQTIYTAFGTVKETVRYANKVVGAVSTTVSAAIVTVAPNPVTGPYLIVDNTRDQHTLIEHDLRNRQTSITDAQNNTESMTYDALGNKTSYTNKLGGTYTYTYSRRGLVTKETAPVTYTAAGVANAAQTKGYQYDARGNITIMTENSSAAADQQRVTNFAYDLENRQVKKSSLPFSGGFNADGTSAVLLTPTETRQYDARGNLIEVAVARDALAKGPANDMRTLYYYDALDRKIVQIDPTGAVTAWVYNGIGKPVSELKYAATIALPATAGGAIPQLPNDPNVRWTDFKYDGNGRMISSTLRNVTIGEQTNIDAGYTTRLQDVVTTYNYDGNGNVVRVIDGRGNPELATTGNPTYSYYNKLNQLIMTVDALNYVTTWTRDANGNVLTETRYATALGSAPASTTTPPAVPGISPDDRITTYTYDRMGNVLTKGVGGVKYGSSSSSQLFVESLSNPTAIWPTFNSNTSFAPTTGTTFTSTVTLGENYAGRRLSLGLDNGIAGADYRRLAVYFYDNRFMVQCYNSSGVYQEIELGGTTRNDTAYVVKVEMTASGPKLTVTSLGTDQMSWVYTDSYPANLSKWTALRVYGGTYSGPDWGTPATRDGVGPLKVVNGGGTQLYYEAFGQKMSPNFDYLGEGWATSQLTFYNNGAGVFETGQAELIGTALTSYQYNGLGQVTKLTESVDTATTEVTDIAYDKTGRKISEKSPQFYDFQNQLVRPETQYVYNGLNQVTSEIELHAAYDTNETDRVTTYAYTQGRLTSQTDPTGAQTKFFYDAAGNIMKKTLVGRTNADVINGVAGATTTDDVTLYRYDASGREVMHQDVGTGEVRGTRYSAFGEVTGRRLGGTYAFNSTTGLWGWSDTNWQEQAEYNVQGKAWRTNSGDGAYKVYLFDANGNATLTIESAGADLATQTLNQILGLEPGANGKPPVAVNTNLTVSIYDARNQLIDTYQPTMVADNRIDWSANQVFTQPPGSPYIGGHIQPQYLQPSPAVPDLTNVVGSFYPSQIGIQLAGHDQDNRGGDHHYFFKPLERTVTFTGLPNYSALGFNLIQIDFVLDRWQQPGFPVVEGRNSFSGTTKSIFVNVGAGATSGEIAFTETGYADERDTHNRNTPNRTGRFIMYAVSPWTGTKIEIGRDNIQFTVDKYFNNHNRDWDRYYHQAAQKYFPVGGRNLLFNVNAVTSFKAATSDTMTLWLRQGGGQWAAYPVPHAKWGDGNPIAGLFSTESFYIADGTYEFFYTLESAAGKPLAAQSGTMTMGAQGATNVQSQPIGAPGYTVANGNAIWVVPQDANVAGVYISYRPKNSAGTWVTAGAVKYNIGWGMAWPTGLTPGVEYEYLVETRNSANQAIGKTKRAFVASNSTTSSISPMWNLVDQMVVFNQEPLGKVGNGQTTMVLQYTSTNPDTNPNAVWTTATKVKQNPGDHTIFTWDPTEALMGGASSGTPVYYRYTIRDSQQTVLTQAKGTVNMSSDWLLPVVTHENYGRLPTTMTFKPIQEEAQFLQLYVRTHTTNANATYTAQARISRNANGGFVWDASAYAPAQVNGKTELDFYYELYETATSTTKLLGLDGQPLKMQGQIIIGGTKADFVSSFQLTGLANTSTTIHRSQSYNAFGEISQQMDGRVNAGTTPGDFMSGRRNFTTLYYNTLGKLIEKEDPYTENLAMVAKDGTVSTPLPTRPRTFYAYDLAGRLVSTQDANGNRNSMTVLAGFGADGSEQAHIATETHADSNRQVAKSVGYDVFGNARSITEKFDATTQRVTLQEFDKADRLTKVTHAARAAGTASYIPTGNVDRYVYDQAGQRIIHYVDTMVGNASNTDNNTLSTQLGTAVTYKDTTKYDSLGRVLKTTDMAGLSTTYIYTYDATIKGAGNAVVGGYIKETILPADGSMAGYTYTSPATTAYDKNDYFGRIAEHRDFGGNVFTYEYNKAGWLIRQRSTGSAAQENSGQQSIDFEYYANGYQKKITDNVSNTVSYYEYDSEGNRIREDYTINGQSYQHSLIEYDQLNRVVYIEDTGRYTVKYQYDANGNRIHVDATYVQYFSPTGNSDLSQDYWYKYDSMNRFTITMGQKNATTNKVEATTTQGVGLGYDWTGQRVMAWYTSNQNGETPHVEQYTYTADGYLEDTRINYGTGWVLQARRTSDGLGRVTAYEEWNSSGTKLLTRRTDYNTSSQATLTREWNGSIVNWNNPLRQTTNTYSNTGLLVRSNYVDTTPNKNLTLNKDYKYVWWDEAKQSKITVQGATQGYSGYWAPGYARFIYDVNGHIKAMNDPAYNSANPGVYIARSVTYTTDAQGRVLMRNQIGNGKPELDGTVTSGSSNATHKFFYVNGRGVGDVGNDGMRRMSYAEALAIPRSNNNDDKYGQSWTPVVSADFDANYEPVTADYPTTTPGTYTVRTGDTLQSIAAATWGDSAMWYLIADANGLVGSEVLVADQVLIIPNKLANIHNNSGTFRVFNAAETMGNTDPTLPPLPAPPPPPRSKKHCGGIGKILIAVVAIVAAVYTAGAALAYFAPAAAGVAGAAGAGTMATLGAGGMAALTGSMGAMIGAAGAAGFGAAIVAAGAIGAAVGSIVSQGLGVATGMQDKFSWKAVGVAAVGGAVTAGLNNVGFAATAGRYLGEIGGQMAQAAVGSAVTQGLSVATGLQEKFSWTQVAVSAGTVAASYGIGSALKDAKFGLGDFGNQVVRGALVDTAVSGLSQLASGQKPDWAAIAMDSFGSSLGNQLVENQILGDRKVAEKPILLVDSTGPTPALLRREYYERAMGIEVGSGGVVDVLPYEAWVQLQKKSPFESNEAKEIDTEEVSDQPIMESDYSEFDESIQDAIYDLFSGDGIVPVPILSPEFVAGLGLELPTITIAPEDRPQPIVDKFSMGQKSTEIQDVQKRMLAAGIDVSPDGAYGKGTQAAIVEYNKKLSDGSLPEDRVGVNPTAAELDAELAKQSKAYGVPLKATEAVMRTESAIQVDKRGQPVINRTGPSSAAGIMQVTYPLAIGLGFDYSDVAYDWKINVEAGVKYYASFYNSKAISSLPDAQRALKSYQGYYNGNLKDPAKPSYDKRYTGFYEK